MGTVSWRSFLLTVAAFFLSKEGNPLGVILSADFPDGHFSFYWRV
jgi:hypothetical protein